MSPHTRHTITAQESCEPRRKKKPPPGPPAPPPVPPGPNTMTHFLSLNIAIPDWFYKKRGMTRAAALACGAWLCANACDNQLKLNFHDCDAGTNDSYDFLQWMGCFQDGPFPEPYPGPSICTEAEILPPCP